MIHVFWTQVSMSHLLFSTFSFKLSQKNEYCLYANNFLTTFSTFLLLLFCCVELLHVLPAQKKGKGHPWIRGFFASLPRHDCTIILQHLKASASVPASPLCRHSGFPLINHICFICDIFRNLSILGSTYKYCRD